MALGNLASRFLVALVAVPPLLLAIYQDQHVYVWGIVFAASLVAMYEFFSMTIEAKQDRVASLVIGAVSVALLYWPSVLGFSMGPILAVVFAVVGSMFYYLFRFGDMATVAPRMAYSVMGVVYAGFMTTFIALVKRDIGGVEGGHFVVLLLVTAWFADTGGYFAGKAFGKSKLYEAVSPKKTWAGSIGGTMASVTGGVAMKLLFLHDLPWVDVVALTFVGSILGQCGDLCESLIKRSTGVKDSGAILPGHGGILDRIDAVIFIAPYVYLYVFVKAFLLGS